MILYSKNGDFLGIGKDELSFLGYEDLDEFKSVNADVADLFMNRPGYIFKFKNFSWIDYALHSGAPKKSAIVKLKSGNEVEVPLRIKELFLYSPTKDEDIYYVIEFVNSVSQNTAVQSESSFIKSTPAPPVEISQKFDEEPSNVDDTEEKPKKISFEEDFSNEVEEEDEDLSIDFTPIEEEKVEEEEVAVEEQPTLKLKIDNDVFEKEETISHDEVKIDINNNIARDYESNEPLKINDDIEEEVKIDISDQITKNYDDNEPLKIDDNTEEEFVPIINISSDYIEDKIEEIPPEIISNDISLNTNIEENEEEIDFDLSICVEKSGLDISLIGELITDYVEKIDNTIPIIKNSLEQNDEKDTKNNIYKLKGISDNLHMNQLSSRLKAILNAEDQESKKIELEKLEKFILKFRGELL